MRKLFTKEQEDFMINNYLSMEYKEIGEILGFTERQIRGRLNNMGYTKNRKINYDYFNNIDTPLKAYFLGYIYADGYIVYNKQKRNYEFAMELQSEDSYILERLNSELGGLNIISTKAPEKRMICNNMCQKHETKLLRIYSKDLVENLIKNGIETNKTQKIIYPVVNDNLFFDFLRGYIDGDGCFWKYKNHYYMHITCASKEPLEYIKNELLKYNIITHLYKETDKKYRLMCVNIKEMKKLVTHIYYEDGLLCLCRKFEKVKYYLGFAA